MKIYSKNPVFEGLVEMHVTLRSGRTATITNLDHTQDLIEATHESMSDGNAIMSVGFPTVIFNPAEIETIQFKPMESPT